MMIRLSQWVAPCALLLIVAGPAMSQPKLNITSPASLPGAQVGVDYSITLEPTGGQRPDAWLVVSGSLPPGLNLFPLSGIISGRPTTVGTSSFRTTVGDVQLQTDSQDFTLKTLAAPPPTITTASLPGGTAGTTYTQTLSASGGITPYNWSVAAGTLPPGLTLSGSGAITGTPTTAGPFDFTVKVTDAASLSASKPLRITVTAAPTPPSITTASLPGGTVGTSYAQTLTASGGVTPYTWSVTAGALPPGLILVSIGAISGTPTSAGAFDFTAKVTDAASLSGFTSLRIIVNVAPTPPVITTALLPAATVGTSYTQSLSATAGTPPYAWSIMSGTLAPGLNLAPSGALSGTPTAAGAYDFTAKVTDSSKLSDSKSLRLTVNAALAALNITTNSVPGGVAGIAYTSTVTASGGQSPYAWSVSSGGLPPGVSLQSSSGQLSGTPSSPGNYVFSLRVTDAGGRTAEKSLTILIVQGVAISACPTPEGLTGTPYSSNVSASGGTPPYTWSVLGQLPAGLALNSTSGALSGTPLVPGTSSFALQVNDTGSQNAARACTITVTIPLTLITQNLPDAATRTTYSQRMAATGGSPPYRWSTSAGSLPPGFILDETTGNVTGIPTQSGRFNFTVTATDSAGRQAQRAYTIYVGAGLTIPACPFPTASVGQSYTSTLAAIGGQTPYAWSVVAGALPAGLTVVSDTGLISGTPTATGTPLFTVQARDSAGAIATRQCSISAAPQLVITTSALASGSTGAAYSDTVVATGGTLPYTWTISGGALPPGLTLNAATGGVSGLPVQTGTFPFTVRIIDAAGIAIEKPLALTVNAGFSISACPIPSATVGQPYSSALSLSGGGPSVAWTIVSGALPPGLALDSGIGSIAGIPVQIGRSDFTVSASNGTSSSASRACSINVSAPVLTITSTPAFPAGVMGSNYDQTLAAAGGRAPYTWAIATGSLPPGMVLGGGGNLLGAPTAAGTFQFTIRVTDQGSASATQLFTLRVLPAAAPAISFDGLPDIVGAAQQPKVTFALDKGYPVPLKGKLTMQFTPDPSVGVDDKSISFVTGGRAVDFDVPANATQPIFPVPQLALQTGTVAGTIALRVQLSAGDIDITPAASQKTIRIDRTAPVISSVKITPVTDGFEVAVTGFSTTREVSTATFQFTPAAGSRLEASDVTVSTAEVARTWYRDPRSNDYGSQFTFIQPFTVRGATLSEVSVTLTNGQGTSQAVRARL